MKIVYIAHQVGPVNPVDHADAMAQVFNNLQAIKMIVRHINLTMPGVVPCAPYWLDCHAMDDTNPAERARGIANNTALIKNGVFHELWLYGPRVSDGIKGEIKEFEEMGLPVVPMSKEIIEIMQKPFLDARN